jgi:hypothetical protein
MSFSEVFIGEVRDSFIYWASQFSRRHRKLHASKRLYCAVV